MVKIIQTAWLIPFMSVAGDPAKNDMAGDGDDSRQSIHAFLGTGKA